MGDRKRQDLEELINDDGSLSGWFDTIGSQFNRFADDVRSSLDDMSDTIVNNLLTPSQDERLLWSAPIAIDSANGCDSDGQYTVTLEEDEEDEDLFGTVQQAQILPGKREKHLNALETTMNRTALLASDNMQTARDIREITKAHSSDSCCIIQ